MKYTLCIVALLTTTSALAQRSPQTTFRDSRGSTIGTATTSGNQTTFRDNRGSVTGYATRDSQGNTTTRAGGNSGHAFHIKIPNV